MIRIIKKFSKILNKQQKVRVVIIGIMMIVGAFLETLGVGLILPLVSAITTPNLIEENKYARLVCEVLDIHTTRTFMIVVIVALIFIYTFKNIYLFIEYYVQYRFICNNRFGVQRRLMETYLKRSYEFFLSADSGNIMRIITDDARQTFLLLSTVLSFFTEATVSAALLLTIIVTDPVMAFLLAIILGMLMLIIGKIIKPQLRKAGLNYQKNTGKMNKWLLQSISGIKEIKVERKEEYFLEQFSKYGKEAIESEKMNSVLGTVPRLSIEALGVSSMLGIIAFMMFKGREVDTLLPQLAAFAMAAVRLMPSVNRMTAALNTMAYQEPALDKMLEHLSVTDRWEQEERREMSNCKIKKMTEKVDKGKSKGATIRIDRVLIEDKVELSNITYFYPNTEKTVLQNASMEIPIGKSVGVVGASGSGKTTAIDILLGLLPPQEGQVLADGIDIQEDYVGWLSQIGYIPQMIFMLDDTIRANVAFGLPIDEVNEEQVWKAIEEGQLGDFVRSLPQGLDTTIGERGVRLSGGQRQRIGIARALYSDPEFLIFDEATSALDNETETAIMESINSLHGKKTLIIIAHRLQTIEECDMVYRVEDGKISRER